MEEKPLAILRSARREGDTRRMVRQLFRGVEVEVADLLGYRIAPYSYSAVYPSADQFMALVERMLRHRKIVFATPVYWYVMSDSMKIFFDRLADLVTIQKSLGR
ncbi:flavodoxin family protein [Nafulsella turpanensis]|uniref:flavodoxin family protein n=1 Tax=Nafulsella turpanensis TaxID=1265690 RepID=UPI00035F8568|nr:NAD(P)H-dependent oxidoreductase [Nafulsella turpanensis]